VSNGGRNDGGKLSKVGADASLLVPENRKEHNSAVSITDNNVIELYINKMFLVNLRKAAALNRV
jgi:hypothetical protein